MNVWSATWFSSIGVRLISLMRRALQGTRTQKTLRHIEWVIIGFTTAVYAYGFLSGYILDFVSPSWGPFPFLLAWFVLSFIFPSDRPVWQRRLYIFVEIALMIIAVSLNLGAEVLLYLFIVKACFLLNRRDVIITIALTGIAYLIPLLWLVPQELEYWRLNPQEVFDPAGRMVMAWAERIFVYITLVTFLVLLSFTILSERKAQKRAEELLKEVEALSGMRERERIARDIHDTLGHTLTTLGIQLEVAQRIGTSDVSQALHRLKTARHLVDQCLQEVRQAVQTMREPDFDLTCALKELIAQMQQMQAVEALNGKPIQSKVQLDLPQLPLQTSYQIYCIVQEGVTNIQKHAGATQVQLRGWSVGDRLLIELLDNGKGFDPAQVNGFGLRGMHERVQILGGTFQVETALGQGTRLTVQVPLVAPGMLIKVDLQRAP